MEIGNIRLGGNKEELGGTNEMESRCAALR